MTDRKTEQSSVKDRLLEFLKFKHLSQKKFEEMTTLSNGYINNMRKSIKDSTYDEKISPVFPELNKMWLLYGSGQMILGNDKEKEDFDNIEIASVIKNKPHDEQMEILFKKIDDLERKLIQFTVRDGVYLESIAAHLGIDVESQKHESDKKEKSDSN